MRIAVIAANGRSGRAFVREALAAGHEVRAGARRANTLEPHPRLTTVKVDATRLDDVRDLVQGQEAVVSLIGHVRGSAADVQTSAMRQTLAVMGELGIRRLVSLTGTGVRFPGDRVTVADRLLNLSIQLIDPRRIGDGKSAAGLLVGSDVDWTLLRVLKLTGAAPRPFGLSATGPTRILSSRRQVAQAILQVLEQNSFVRQAPMLTPLLTGRGHDLAGGTGAASA
jgi:hypothetical protein